MLPARVRTDAQWCDAQILNISSRGLLIQSLRPAPEGSSVQIVRGDHLIVARVMWSKAGRSGLRSEGRLPVDEIMSVKQLPSLRLIASNGTLHDRRRSSRAVARDARLGGRAFEFVAISAIAVTLAVGVWGLAHEALANPLASAAAALGS
jgi:hypothetical protein